MKKKLEEQLNKFLPNEWIVSKDKPYVNKPGGTLTFYIEQKPTKKELLEKAKRDYPEGTVFKIAHSKEVEIVKNHDEFKYTFVNSTEGLHINFICEKDHDLESINTGASVYACGKWAKIISKPIFKLNNKFMYEGDEYWELYKDNYILKKQVAQKNISEHYQNDKDFEQFLTKQEALEFVLEEAKERFKNASQAACQKSEPFNINSDKFFIEHVGYHETIGNEKNYVWTENKGFVAKPIKEPSLMLGNEVVYIEKTLLNKEDVMNADEHVLIPRIWDIKIICKGESVTKEEWMEWYNDFSTAVGLVDYLKMKLGKFDVHWSKNPGDTLTIGCIEDFPYITIDQIEAITS
jgi:hypothetical protein